MKDYLLSLRIDSETAELIAFLRNRKYRYTDIIRPMITHVLKEKCKELEFKESKQYCPF